MGDDNGHSPFGFDRYRVLKEFFNGELQFGCGIRVKLSRHCRFTNVSVRHFICLTRNSKTKTNHEQYSTPSQDFHFS